MLRILLIVGCVSSAVATYQGDPSRQEIELFEWTGGARLPFCIDAPLQEVAATFKKAIGAYITAYCAGNRTHCNLRENVVFGPQHVIFMEGFPRREFDSLNLRFMVMLPHDARTYEKQIRPLLPRSVLAATLVKFTQRFRNDLNWHLISIEKRVSPFLADNRVHEHRNHSDHRALAATDGVPRLLDEHFEAQHVHGVLHGVRGVGRTLEIIAEQNLEYERERKLALTRHIQMSPPRDVVGRGVGMLLDVAKLSIDTAHLPSDRFRKKARAEDREKLTASASQPQINIEPGSETPSLADLEQGGDPAGRLAVPLQEVPEHEALQIEDEDEYDEQQASSFLSVQNVHPHYARAHRQFRRLSSFDEVGVSKRRASRPRLSTSTGSSSGGRRQWKSGSLMLFGGRKG